MIFGNEIDIYRRKYGYNRAVETLDLMKTKLINRETNIEKINYHTYYNCKSYIIETNNIFKKTDLFKNLTSLFIYYKDLCHIDIEYAYNLYHIDEEKKWINQCSSNISDIFNNKINNFTCYSFLHNGFTLYNTKNVKRIIYNINQYKNEIHNKEKKNKIVVNETFVNTNYKGNNANFELEYYNSSIPKDTIFIPNSYAMNEIIKYKILNNNFITINNKKEIIYYFYPCFCYKIDEIKEKYSNELINSIEVPKSITIKETNEELEFPQEFIDIVIETDYENSRFYFDPDQYYRKQKLLNEINPKRKIKKSIFKKYFNHPFKIFKSFKKYLYFYYFNF